LANALGFTGVAVSPGCITSQRQQSIHLQATLFHVERLSSRFVVFRGDKQVTAGNAACYTLPHLKSGRRTVGGSVADVLVSGTQLKGRSTVSSLHEEALMSAETDETVPVSELMSRDEEDPSTKATRKLDWQQFHRTQDQHNRQLLACLAEGCDTRAITGKLKLTRLAVRRRTDQRRTALKLFFGDGVLAEVCRSRQWFNDLRAVKEHLASRGERNWQTH